VTAEHGTPPGPTHVVALRYRGEDVGELVVGVRAGQAALDRADRAALELLAVPLAAVVHATALTEAVQRSREQIVGAREEERRRLRRDLHDGLGPVLTGIAFRADAAGNFLATDPDRAGALLQELRSSATQAIDDVRRLVYALHPPALDELGLVGALRRHMDQYDGERPVVALHAAEPLPPLSAAVEVAAYRIAVEAVTNAVRHADASRVEVHLSAPRRRAVAGRDRRRPRARRLGRGRRPHLDAGADRRARGLGVSGPGHRWRPGGREAAPVNAVNALRVVLADDHPVVRDGLSALLSSVPGIEVVRHRRDRAGGGAGRGHRGARRARPRRPDARPRTGGRGRGDRPRGPAVRC
jgi:hypothetical protein